ncbi:MAG: hypothetical protein HOV81_31210 [Kofleriaceae bacterium]|nr:hypothetical protein [Kofleriaceae bacterium]
MDEGGRALPPSIEDIHQGNKSFDCYVMASLAALAHTRPETIVKMIHDHGGGVYTVHFREPGWSVVSPSVTLDFEKEKHAGLGPRNALWPLVIEKAYGQTKGRMENLNVGGSPAGVLRDMADMQTSSFFVTQRDPDAILGVLAKAMQEQKAVTAMTPSKAEGTEDANRTINVTRGLVVRHAYLVTDVDSEGRRVKLFNPWGYNHPNDSGWLSIDVFKKSMLTVNISG